MYGSCEAIPRPWEQVDYQEWLSHETWTITGDGPKN